MREERRKGKSDFREKMSSGKINEGNKELVLYFLQKKRSLFYI